MIRASRTVTAAVAGVFLAATAATATSPAVAETQAPARTTTHQQAAREVALPNGFRPEGIASGPGDTYYAGSMADGRIVTGDLSRGTQRVLLPGVTGRALRGMQYDSRSKLLWVVGQDSTQGIVLVVDTRTGALKNRIEIPGAQFLNDIVLTRTTAWVTDSRVDSLTSIDKRTKHLATRQLTGDWPTEAEGNHANGIRELRTGELVLDHSTSGGLYTVNPKTGGTTKIPGSDAITGGDGLELDHGTLYVVRGTSQTSVSVVDLKQKHHRWTAKLRAELTSSRLDVPSTATLVKRSLWAVNARFGVADPTTAAYWITELPTRH